MPRGVVGLVVVLLLLALYGSVVVSRGIGLVRTGNGVGIGIGIAVLVLPLLVLGLIAAELRLATRVQRMADQLAAAGELPVDDLPRSPGGRIDRGAADAAFGAYRDAVEAAPESWQAWYRLAFAYDASGDRKRARAALRKAAALY
ncbi:tetratricopeptide repeat protein [Xylanimonas protaetiae]|uniref:Tetratricopeptide repeat protein n=1 Tax=Xylanimonas protaetiae TaxID=2509457 RepID=A0A4P6F7S6_9MICO|nr:tetratricopeptide repeat protein [Xylanimonas protaetiae]